MASRQLTLIIPELASYLLQGTQDATHLKLLNKLLRKGRFTADSQSLTAFLINSFSKEFISGSDLPVAELRQTGKTIICADPCYLHPDRDRLLLFSQEIKLSQQEAKTLIAAVQPLLDIVDGKLEHYRNDQWLLKLPQPPQVTFHALPSVEGKSVTPALPIGPDKDKWLRLGNEIQMLLSMHPLNEQRQARGDLPVNSLWFWGQGQLKIDSAAWQQCAGDSSLLSDLAVLSKADYQQTVVDITTWLRQGNGNSLYVTSPLNVMDAQSVFDIEQTLLQPVWRMLRSGQIKQLKLFVPDYGTYTLTRWDSWKPW